MKGMTSDQFMAHSLGHRIDDRVGGAQAGLEKSFTSQIAQLRTEIASIPGAIGQHFHHAIDGLDPTHQHFTEMLEHATAEGDDACPACQQVKGEYDAKLTAAARETFEAEQDEAAAAQAAAAAEAKREEPPKPAPVKPKVWDAMETDFNFLGVTAYGMEYEETDDGDGTQYVVWVKPGEEEEAKQGIEDGMFKEPCVIRTDENGKQWICDPEPAPATAS